MVLIQRITGVTNDYRATAGSDICVITSGIPRKPGMTREELIGINAGIVQNVSAALIEQSPETILVVVSNPMDTMTYLAHKVTGLPKNRIIGMGGALDSARFKYRLAEALDAPSSDIDGMVIGGHSDTGMIPLTRLATRSSVPVSSEFLSTERLDEVREATKVGGATLTKLLGTFRLVCSWCRGFYFGSKHRLRSKENDALFSAPCLANMDLMIFVSGFP